MTFFDDKTIWKGKSKRGRFSMGMLSNFMGRVDYTGKPMERHPQVTFANVYHRQREFGTFYIKNVYLLNFTLLLHT